VEKKHRHRRLCGLPDGCLSTSARVSPTYWESKPQKALIYNDGNVILEERIEDAYLASGGIILPVKAILETVTIYQNDSRLKYYTIEKKEVTVSGVSGKPFKEQRYVINLPEYDEKSSLILRYGITGIDWTPKIEANMRDEKTLTLYLNAVISPRADNLTDCDITLVNSNSRYKSSAEEDSFHLGKIDLLANRTVFYLLNTVTVGYTTYYKWDASSDEDARLILAFSNPFKSAIDSCPFVVTSNNVVVNQGTVYSMNPGEAVELESGIEPLIKTFRSITTKEDTKKEILAFNHAFTLRVQNLKGAPIILKLYFQKKLGEVHRNVYHFPIPPDEKPGEWFIWNLTLPKDDVKEISFDFDSDAKDFSEYMGYDYYEGGR
jgi:hypothetical protein